MRQWWRRRRAHSAATIVTDVVFGVTLEICLVPIMWALLIRHDYIVTNTL